jgi:hypothetical protein
VTNSENLDGCWLDNTQLEELLTKQVEGTFMWVNKTGQPFGVISYYLWRDGSFWFTCAEKRARVSAIRRTGYASFCVTSKGTDMGGGKTASFRGPCEVHTDQTMLNWVLRDIAKACRPESEEGAQEVFDHINTPNRVVLELKPEFRFDFDSAKMWEYSGKRVPPGRYSGSS